MCGLIGFWQHGGFDASDAHQTAKSMADQIIHRGPDDGGVWVDPGVGIALAHRRLSILDLSLLGHQPMISASGRFVIVYNGEVYNFKKLQNELEKDGYSFRSHSDTEVVLSAVECWGIKEALKRFVGMFAFALWDKSERTLTLARDRIGEKPLYYGWQGKSLLFGSELKALRQHSEWQGGIDRNALTLMMRHNYIPAPYSIYIGIHKLMPGTFIQFHDSMAVGGVPPASTYWSAQKIAEQGVANPFVYSDQEAINALDQLLGESIQEKMIADVPLGSFLSGGIDSSTVVALMQASSSRQVKTFSIGFHEKDHNEAQYAKAVAKHLRTEHTELYVTAEQAINIIPKLPQLYDEPFSDCSQVPTFLLSQMTSQHVKVALSGDGGDELFAGYNRYLLGDSLWNNASLMPKAMRDVAARCITSVSPQVWDRAGMFTGTLVPSMKERAGDKLYKLAGALSARSQQELYQKLVTHWPYPELTVLGGVEPLTALTDMNRHAKLAGTVQQMQFLDMVSYLPDDILVKVDRAAMGVSLETRVPFLDHRIVEFSWHLPMSMKIRDGQGKWILRQVLDQYVPKELIDRPKMGFGIPIDTWLRGSLREWSEELLSESRLKEENIFNVPCIREKWQEHLSGRRNWQYLLWDVLMFQAWLETQ